jgi:hypothetical protein
MLKLKHYEQSKDRLPCSYVFRPSLSYFPISFYFLFLSFLSFVFRARLSSRTISPLISKSVAIFFWAIEKISGAMACLLSPSHSIGPKGCNGRKRLYFFHFPFLFRIFVYPIHRYRGGTDVLNPIADETLIIKNVHIDCF